MKTALTVAFLLVGPLQTAFAASATVSDESCGTQDQFNRPARITKNSRLYANQCVNMDKFRPVKILLKNANEIKFTNYLHNREYFTATIPLTIGAVQSAIVQVIPMEIAGVTAGHVQIRFKMAPGHAIELVSQKDPETKITHDDVVISFEAAFPKDVSYNFALGLIDNYPLVARVLSGAQKAADSTEFPFVQLELNLEPSEIVDRLSYLIQRSEDLGINEFYNTLRPNCTTEIMDALDLLPRFQAKGIKPFRTQLSTDPIIGPVIEALKERNLIRRRLPDFQDEVKGATEDLPVPSPKSADLAYLPRVPGLPLTLLAIQPDSSKLGPAAHEALSQLDQDLIAMAPQMLNEILVSSLMSGMNTNMAAKVLGSALKTVMGHLRTKLVELNPLLPETPHVIQLVFAPFESDGQTQLDEYGVQAAVPISVLRKNGLSDKNRGLLIQQIQRNMNLVDQNSANASPAYVRGLVIRINAQRNRSFAEVQLVTALNELNKPVQIANQQVKISELIVPNRKMLISAPGGKTQTVVARPTMIMTYRQDLMDSTPSDDMSLEFGPLDASIKSVATADEGKVQVFRNDGWVGKSCAVASFGPRLKGVFAEKALDFSTTLSGMLEGRAVDFHIPKILVDVDDMRVRSLQVRANVLGLGTCVQQDFLDRKFEDEANESIAKLKEELRQKLSDDQYLKSLLPGATSGPANVPN